MSLKTLVSSCAIATVVLLPIQTFACSTCLCGDPTLTVMGAEKPFAGRKRVSLESLFRTESIGRRGIDRVDIDEHRLSLGFSYTFNPRVAVSLRLPWVDKQLENSSLARSETQGIGDINVTAKIFLQPQTGMVRRLYGLTAGVTLPTAEEKTSASGQLLDIDVQPGVGSTVAQLGVWYGQYAFPWFFYASSALNIPTEGNQDFTPGTAVTLTLRTQYAPRHRLAFQLGLDTRWSEKDKYGDIADSNSGGFLGFLSPGVVITLSTDLLLQLQTQIPVIDELNGHHEEETTYSIGIIYDF